VAGTAALLAALARAQARDTAATVSASTVLAALAAYGQARSLNATSGTVEALVAAAAQAVALALPPATSATTGPLPIRSDGPPFAVQQQQQDVLMLVARVDEEDLLAVLA
jgi:hypothetical protein